MEDQEKVISELYDLVGAPDQYDAFMLKLQEKLEALRDTSDQDTKADIVGHMARASALLDIVTPWRRETDAALHKTLTQRMQATLALDETGNIIDANSSAKVVYNLLPSSDIGALPLEPEDVALLRMRVRQIAERPDQVNAANDVLRLTNSETFGPLLVRLEPYVQDSTKRLFVICRTGDIGWPSHLGPILQDLFDVSRAEVDVIRLLVEGHKVKEIAGLRRASATTVRSQLQSIFAKTQTKDQMDLVRMVFGLAMMHDADEGNLVATRIEVAKQTAFFPREDQRHVVTLPDGRRLEYSDFGAAAGPCILWYHDQSFGDVWFKEPVALAKRKGFRIIGPLRPGFGQTTIYPGEASEPRDFAPDIHWLMDHLNIDRAAILASSLGLMHGLAAAALMPDRIASVTTCHPLLPVRSDEDLEGTNGYNYLIPHARLHFPAALKFLVKAGFAFVMRSGPAAFGKAVMRASAWDVDWIMRPDILPVMVHGRRVHRDQGYVGTFGDLNYREDWSPLLRDCPVPVRLVIGEHDRNVQWGAARRWSEALDHVALHVLPDSGYMVFHQQYSQLLRWVEEDLAKAPAATA